MGYVSLLALAFAALATSRFLGSTLPPGDVAMSRVGCLDGARGFLALAVMAHHFRIAWNWRLTGRWEPPAEALFANLGPAGVILFFMITGFLFWRKLVRSSGRIGVVRLFVSRVFRIYPAYLLSLAAIALLSFASASDVAPLPARQALDSLVSWLFFSGAPDIAFRGFGEARLINAGVIWTLKYEWLFYASLPVVGLALAIAEPGRRIRVAVLVASIAGLTFGGFTPIGWFDPRIVVGFLYGCLAFEILESDAVGRILRRPAVSVLVVAALTAMLLSSRPPYDPLNFLVLSFPFAAVAAGNSMFGLLSSRFGVALGDASYSLYLFHGVFLFAFFTAIPASCLDRPWIWALLPVLGALASAWCLLVFRYWEKPAIRFGQALRRRSSAIAATEGVAP